jgi:hypothetical protein
VLLEVQVEVEDHVELQVKLEEQVIHHRFHPHKVIQEEQVEGILDQVEELEEVEVEQAQ